MQNLFDTTVFTEIVDRINRLTPNAQHLWGKMNVAQMMAHCSASLETATGQKNPPRIFIGRIVGPFVRNSFLNEKPFAKNTPTDKSFIIKDDRDFNKEKEKLKDLILAFSKGGEEKCTTHPHSFFGKLIPKEWSIGMYKHLDHHLRQFGV